MTQPRERPATEIIAGLESYPPRIAAICAGLSAAQLQAAPGVDEWSAAELLAHLRSCSDVWGRCIRRIVEEDGPAYRRVSPRSSQKAYSVLEFSESFDRYRQQRAVLIEFLRTLPPDSWSRRALVRDGTRTRVWSVRYYAEWLASHEAVHIGQFEQIVRSVSPRHSS